jgi:DNA-binding NarL/FixJ family response regulator
MMKSEFKILLINGICSYTNKIENVLSDSDKTPMTLEIAENLPEGLDCILKGGIEVILLGQSSPELYAPDVLKALHERSITLPVIVLIGPDDEDYGIRAIKEGAHDYLSIDAMDRDSLSRSVRYAMERCKILEELRIANMKIMEQKISAIEEERLKGLIEEYGSAAHELNQPLTALLGSVYLMKLDKDNQEKISGHMERIEDSGKRMSGIVKKIQAIRHEKNKNCLGGASLMNPDQKLIPNIKAAENDFNNLNNLFRLVQARCNGNAI